MTDINGVAITDITAFGCSDDGDHLWVTHRLRDGTEYRLVYPYGAAAHLIALFSEAARSAYSRRAVRNPQEVAAGMDSRVIPIEEVRLGTSPDSDGATLHLTTADRVPIAVDLPPAVLTELTEQLQRIAGKPRASAPPKRHLH